MAVQNHFVELNEGADSPCSITFAFKRLRRSDRLASQAKRTYEAMQVASKKTGKLPKRLKLATDKPATDESNTYGTADDETVDERLVVDKPASCEPARDDPATEPATLESINNPSVIKPNTTGPRETLSEGIHREGTDGVMTGSALASPVDGDGGALGSDLSAITHADGLAILDEYFPKSATDSGPLNGAVVPELPTSIANIAPPGSPLIPSIQPPAPGAFTTPSAGPNAVLSEASDILPPEQLGSLYPEQSGILYPEQAVNGFEASDSTSHSHWAARCLWCGSVICFIGSLSISILGALVSSHTEALQAALLSVVVAEYPVLVIACLVLMRQTEDDGITAGIIHWNAGLCCFIWVGGLASLVLYLRDEVDFITSLWVSDGKAIQD